MDEPTILPRYNVNSETIYTYFVRTDHYTYFVGTDHETFNTFNNPENNYPPVQTPTVFSFRSLFQITTINSGSRL